MQRVLALMVLVGCGGGSESTTSDAPFNQGPDYDLSCLGNEVATVPTTITLDGTLYNATTLPDLAPIGNSTITAYSLTDDTPAGTAQVTDDGMFALELTTSGTPTRMRYAIESQLVPTSFFVNIPPWKSASTVMFVNGTGRIDALASALGATADPSKGALEVWINDCSSPELVGASLQLDGADVPWAMFAGTGAWLPRATTLGHPQNAPIGSIAGTINVAPGVHTITVTAPGLTLESTAIVEAGGWSVLIMVPGVPRT